MAFWARTGGKVHHAAGCYWESSEASGGRAALFGRDPWRDAVALHRDIAYVPGEVTLRPSLTGGETIDLLARMRGGIDQRRRGELIERFALDPTKKVRNYSKGQPTEGVTDLRPFLQRPTVAARRTQQRPGPIDGERLSSVRS